MTLALVRHGRTPWNLAQRMQGTTDIALADEGRRDALAAADALAGFARDGTHWKRVVASPLARARESAELIAERLGHGDIDVIDALIEREYGAVEGLPVADVRERWPSGEYPGAESLTQVADRAVAILLALADLPGPTIVVGHGTVLRTGIARLLGTPYPRIRNGQVVLLDRVDGEWRVHEAAPGV